MLMYPVGTNDDYHTSSTLMFKKKHVGEEGTNDSSFVIFKW